MADSNGHIVAEDPMNEVDRILDGGPRPTIVSLGEFVAVDEPGAAPLLGDDEGALIAEGSDVMVYGVGGSGKTTLLFDLAFHLAAGKEWLGIPVARPLRVLLIENEGPRPLLRLKLRRKLDAWSGPDPSGRISVFEEPWGAFRFDEEAWRGALAAQIAEFAIDVLVAGPLARLGMDGHGTLQETAEFMALVDDVRRFSCRPTLTVALVHHENKSGSVSGAWEGAGDTLLHVEAVGNGHTVVHVAKARWASAWHDKTLKLAWTDGEGFELEGDRDYVAEIRELLADGKWRTVKQIMAARDDGGIGAGEKAIRQVLERQIETFEMRTGDAAKALGRAPTSKIYGLRSAASAVGADGALQGGGEGVTAPAPPLKGADTPGTPRMFDDDSALEPERRSLGDGWTDEQLQELVDGEDDE